MVDVEAAEILGRGIKARRQSLRLSQKSLAQACGVSPVTAWRWESGRQLPSSKHLGAICAALDIEAADLFKEPK